MADRKIIDRALLTRLAGLKLPAGHIVEGVLTGMHKSPHYGASVEFAQHREYAPGDEIRHIDWKAYGRSDRYVVKQFEDETNLRCYMLVDMSGSMDYAGDGKPARPTKLEYAAQMAAGLAWLMLRQGDATGLLTFGETLGSFLPPRARGDHFWRMVSLLESQPVGGQTDVIGALQHVAEVAGRRSLIMLFSDCFDFSGKVAAVARQLQRRNHRVALFHVLDPAEVDFPFSDLTLFENMEDAADRVLANPRGMREQYLVEMREFCENLRRDLLDGGVAYHRMITDVPVEHALRRVLRGHA